MNCKEGDLAIIVKSNEGWNGIIVECVRICEYDTWEIKPKITNGKLFNMCLDSILLPIRDSDKQDEMLNIIKIKEPINA